MKTLTNYISEWKIDDQSSKKIDQSKVEIDKTNDGKILNHIKAKSKWYMSAYEVKEASEIMDFYKPAKFIFYAYTLYVNYDVYELGVTNMFPASEKIWYVELIQENNSPKTPAYKFTDYFKFGGLVPNDIAFVGTKWKINNGVYVASNKKYRITEIKETPKEIIFIIDDKNRKK